MDLNNENEEEDCGPVPLRASKRRRVQRPDVSGNRSRYAGSNSIQFVGRRITVFWEYDAKWYSGTIREYSPAIESYLVLYDDGIQSSEDLDDCTWEWEDERGNGPSGVDEVPTEAGGLKLHLSGSGSTGYTHVYPAKGRFRARIKGREGEACLGTFDTAVEAAVAVAMKMQELTQTLVTETQGLKLHLSSLASSTTGYPSSRLGQGTCSEPQLAKRVCQAHSRQPSKRLWLWRGTFRRRRRRGWWRRRRKMMMMMRRRSW